jgi:ABC-2 type transport system permease protein
MLWILNWVSEFGTTIPERVLSYIAVTSHFESFAKGVLDLKDIVYYLSVIFVGLFLTARSMEALRWRA